MSAYPAPRFPAQNPNLSFAVWIDSAIANCLPVRFRPLVGEVHLNGGGVRQAIGSRPVRIYMLRVAGAESFRPFVFAIPFAAVRVRPVRVAKSGGGARREFPECPPARDGGK